MGRREDIVRERTRARRAFGSEAQIGTSSLQPTASSIVRADARTSTIDLGGAPYTVPCPVCNANACAPCTVFREGARRPTLLVVPHPERVEEWNECPKKRVVPVR